MTLYSDRRVGPTLRSGEPNASQETPYRLASGHLLFAHFTTWRSIQMFSRKAGVAVFTLSDTRLEFRSFGAVKHLMGALHLPDYLATASSHPHPHLPDYSVAHTTAISVFRRSSHRQAARAATTEHIFSDRLALLRPNSQQRAAIKAAAPIPRRQQHFSFTPSESNSLFIGERVEISSSPKQLIDFASAWEVQ